MAERKSRHHISEIETQEKPMKFALLGAAALAATALVGPSNAQHVISDPGYCAQFYPNANCQNTGPDNPYTGDYQARTLGNHYASMDMGHRRWHHTHRNRRDH
jgi:hypothetical protein